VYNCTLHIHTDENKYITYVTPKADKRRTIKSADFLGKIRTKFYFRIYRG